nr:Chain A, ASLTVS segment from Light-Chain Variable Domain, Lambda Mcg [Homo sapiens]6DJ0_B Chain B, ASLTVS segment from Light-Chain Variable Domain, Lambda Mcg [Homo sapiens]
ASLTVS